MSPKIDPKVLQASESQSLVERTRNLRENLKNEKPEKRKSEKKPKKRENKHYTSHTATEARPLIIEFLRKQKVGDPFRLSKKKIAEIGISGFAYWSVTMQVLRKLQKDGFIKLEKIDNRWHLTLLKKPK